MSNRRPRRSPTLAAALFLAFLGLSGGTARAQYGYGYGYGFGGFLNGGGAASDRAMHSYLNQQSLLQGQAALSKGEAQGYQGAGNPYFTQARDTSVGRNDVSTRRDSIYGGGSIYGGESTRRLANGPGDAAEPRPTQLPLESFFSPEGELVWSESAPDSGPYGSLQGEASTSASEVYRESKTQGYSPVAVVTDARAKLVAYGRPALAELRRTASRDNADRFHQFLMTLYDALGRAAVRPPSS